MLTPAKDDPKRDEMLRNQEENPQNWGVVAGKQKDSLKEKEEKLKK